MHTFIQTILLAIVFVSSGLNPFQDIQPVGATEDTLELPSSPDEEIMISEQFAVQEGATLFIDIAHAEVTILTSSRTSADVEVSLESNRMSRARERFERMNWQVHQEEGNIVVTAETLRGWNNVNMDIDVTVHIPARFNIDVVTTHGDVDLESIEGELSVVTTHGDVQMDDVMSSRIRVTSSHGDIEGRELSADTIELRTSLADIEVNRVDSGEFSAITSHADVDIGLLRGESRIRTSHGDVDVALADDMGLDVETEHGDVDVRLAKEARMDLDLRGGDVDVSSSVDVNGRISEDTARGRINGGGAALRVRTTYGEIHVR